MLRTHAALLIALVWGADRAYGAWEAQQREAEIGGPKGLDPVRYGDWERKGRAIDF